jgi:hypothetical protein
VPSRLNRPSAPAIRAMIRKTIAQRNIFHPFRDAMRSHLKLYSAIEWLAITRNGNSKKTDCAPVRDAWRRARAL